MKQQRAVPLTLEMPPPHRGLNVQSRTVFGPVLTKAPAVALKLKSDW